MNERCPYGSGKPTSLALSSFHPPGTSIAVDSQCVASAAIRLSYIKVFQLCTTGFNTGALSAAHPTLPFGTKVRVSYLKTGQSVEVIINDRGPRAKSRIIDLSGAAAKKIGLIDAGHGKVRLEIVEP